MKKTLCFLALFVLSLGATSQAQTTTFTANGATPDVGSIHTYTVPAGITAVTITATGGSGGNSSTNSKLGGKGASVSARIIVLPGETLNILVGKAGGNGGTRGSGGGGTFVTRGSFMPANLLVAAGGGGGANFSTDGAGSTLQTPGSTSPGTPASGGDGAPQVGNSSTIATGGTGGGAGGTNSSLPSTNYGGYGGGGCGGTSLVNQSTGVIIYGGSGGGGGFNGGNGGNGEFSSTSIKAGGGGGGGAFGGTAGTGGTNSTGSVSSPGSAGSSWIIATALTPVFTASSNTGNGQVTISTAIPLPLKLLTFNASSAGQPNRISWETAEEEGGTRYGIERSADATAFAPIGEVSGGEKGSYTFYDNEPAQLSYYRLRISEMGQPASYSNTAVVRRSTSNSSQVRIYPVPVTDVLYIETGSALAGSRATIVDVQGRVVREFILPLNGGVSTANWLPGIYTLRLADGTVQKIVKQ